MIPFATKCARGRAFLGITISDADLMKLKSGKHVEGNLESCDVGIWFKNDDGTRTFIQPRDSKIVLIAGNDLGDIGSFLKVDLK